MASSTLAPYRNNANQVTFNLVSSSVEGSLWRVSGRSIATPYGLELKRKINPGKSNDHVQARVFCTERNASTSVLATAQISLDISIPKDNSILTNAAIIDMLGVCASLLNENVANNAGVTSRTALVEGRDL